MWSGLHSNGVKASAMSGSTCSPIFPKTVCAGPGGLSSTIPTTQQLLYLPVNGNPSLGGTLVRFYNALLITDGQPNAFLKKHFWKSADMYGTGGRPPVFDRTALTPPLVAEFYRNQYLTGCQTTNNSVYCSVGCSAWQPDAEIAPYLWNHWCGTTTDVVAATGNGYEYRANSFWSHSSEIRPILEQLLRDEGHTAIYGYSTRPQMSDTNYRTTMLGSTLRAENFYKVPSLLGYKKSKVCWSSRRGTIGDYAESLGGTCFTDTNCYVKTVTMYVPCVGSCLVFPPFLTHALLQV